jgi:hypothetical protein
MLPDTGMLTSVAKYFHEVYCADVYVILHSYCEEWTAFFQFKNGLIPDRTFTYNGTRFYLEMDMGNEKKETLIHKIERYREVSGRGEKVVFLCENGDHKAESTIYDIINYCTQEKLGDFITAGYYQQFIKAPFGQYLISPKSGRISIDQLCQPLNG